MLVIPTIKTRIHVPHGVEYKCDCYTKFIEFCRTLLQNFSWAELHSDDAYNRKVSDKCAMYIMRHRPNSFFKTCDIPKPFRISNGFSPEMTDTKATVFVQIKWRH